jgi:hypothetical protein
MFKEVTHGLIDLFDIDTLADLVWVNSFDLSSIEYCQYKLKNSQDYQLMVELVKFIFS